MRVQVPPGVFNLNKTSLAIVEATNKGYYVNKIGEVFSRFNKLKLYINTTGYYTFSLKTKYGKKSIPVHRLQAYQKYKNQLFKQNIVVRHLDGNPLNNSYENIVIGSLSDNQLDRKKEDRLEHAKLAAKHLRKLTDKQLIEFRYDRKILGFTYKQLMNKYNLAKATVSYIVNGKTYKGI